MGATEKRAVDELFALGAEVRVAFDARTTKLHAKAWLLERGSGLTHRVRRLVEPLAHGAVRRAGVERPAVVDGRRARHRSRADDVREPLGVRALRAVRPGDQRRGARAGACASTTAARWARRRRSRSPISTCAPYPHQQRMLDALTIERERHDRHRNLVVAATGTGKTVVAALDYRQLLERTASDLSLLFVAHREEILRQSLATYRAVLRDGAFGEIHGGGRIAAGPPRLRDGPVAQRGAARADRARRVRRRRRRRVPSRRGRRPTTGSSTTCSPRELLGLTATPERLDGQDVTEWFDHRIAVELRLWEAIDQGFLVPFQYFGVADGTDLRQLAVAPRRLRARGAQQPAHQRRPARGEAARGDSAHRARPGPMRALGFCVSKEHAHYMARKFTEAGPAERRADRRRRARRRDRGAQRAAGGAAAVRVLRRGARRGRRRSRRRLRAAAAPDRVGDGVHAAARPRPAPRGGQEPPDRDRPDRPAPPRVPLRGSTAGRSSTRDAARFVEQVEADFPFLPAGCTVDLDRQSREIVLDNLEAPSAARAGRRSSPISAREPTTSALASSSSATTTGSKTSTAAAQLDAAPPRRRPTHTARDRRRARSANAQGARPAHPRRRPRARRVLRRSLSRSAAAA